MQPQNPRVAVLFASVFAVSMIAAAGFISYMRSNPPEREASPVIAVGTGAEGGAAVGENESAAQDWQKTLARANTAGKYTGLSLTDALASGLGEQYETLLNPAVPEEEKEEILKNIVAKAAPAMEQPKTYALTDLSLSTTTDMEEYALLLSLVVRQATEVREYEMATFARAVAERNHSGSPELIEASTIYTRIRDTLLMMSVPEKVAPEHIAFVNSLGALAQIVSVMGTWNGDPSLGVVYVNTFQGAQYEMGRTLVNLIDKVEQLKRI